MSQRIIWFCLDKAKSVGAEPIIAHIQSDVLQVYECRLPMYYAVKKRIFKRTVTYTTWNRATLLQTMQNCCLTLCADKYYVDAELESMEITEPAFWNVRQRIEEELLTDRLRNIDRVNQILWIPGKESVCRSIPMELLRKVQRFYVLHVEESCEGISGERKAFAAGNIVDETAEKRKAIRDTENFLWNEYGMPLMYIDSVEEIFCKREERLMILSDNDRNISLKQVPCKIFCFDLWSDEKLRKRLKQERPDAKYFSEYGYLQKLVNDNVCN